jgi:hypothetical protein
MHGGFRPGAGRKPGSPNKKTSALTIAAAEAGLMPLDLMLMVLRDEQQEWPMRMEAAKSAAPYCHARIAAKEPAPSDDGRVHYRVTVDWISPSHSAVPYIAREPNFLNIIDEPNDGPA